MGKANSNLLIMKIGKTKTIIKDQHQVENKVVKEDTFPANLHGTLVHQKERMVRTQKKWTQ